MYFSNLVFLLNCFLITPFINTALFLANIGSFLGTIVLLALNPEFPYANFKERIPISNPIFNSILIVMHAVPLYLFYERQTLRETFEPKVIGATGLAFLVYFMAVRHELPLLYGVSAELLGKLALFMLGLFLGVHVIFFRK